VRSKQFYLIAVAVNIGVAILWALGWLREIVPKEVTSMKSKKIGRDARTGEFIPVKEAQRRKSTAVVETIPVRKKGKK